MKYALSRRIAAGFTALAMHMGAIPAPAPLPASTIIQTDPLNVIRSLFTQGHRGFVMGELHADLSLPFWLAQQMKELKGMGVDTLFIEAPKNHHPIIERMKRRDSTASLEWNKIAFELDPGTMQVRTMLIEAALAADIRVVPFDMSISDQLALNTKDPARYRQRLLWADPEMEKNIREKDDGGRYIVYVGLAHTYPAGMTIAANQKTSDSHGAASSQAELAEQLSCPDWQRFLLIPYTAEGGLNTRLGIPGIDSGNCPSQLDNAPASITRSAGRGADYIIRTPSHPLQDIGFPGHQYQGWRNLLAEDAQNLFMPSFSGPPGSVPAAEAALAILDYRNSLKPGVTAAELNVKSKAALEVIDTLVPSAGLTLNHIHDMKRHISQMGKAAAYMQEHGPFAERMPVMLMPRKQMRQQADEEQVALMQSRLSVQLQSMYDRGMGTARAPLSAALRP